MDASKFAIKNRRKEQVSSGWICTFDMSHTHAELLKGRKSGGSMDLSLIDCMPLSAFSAEALP